MKRKKNHFFRSHALPEHQYKLSPPGITFLIQTKKDTDLGWLLKRIRQMKFILAGGAEVSLIIGTISLL